MKTLLKLLMLCLLTMAFSSGLAQDAPIHTQIVYGQSELGRDLICHRIGHENARTSILLVFGVHGYEDAFPRDGEVLYRIAESLIAHYSENPPDDACLYIIPSANPDGLIEGKTKDGFGRCNALGLDINRDFPIGWKIRTGARNRTGKAPFSSAEARAIRDLVERIKPAYGIDVHGWINASYGTGTLAKTLAEPFDFPVKTPTSGGMLVSWLDDVTEDSAMIELPQRPYLEAYVEENSAKLIAGLDLFMERVRIPAN